MWADWKNKTKKKANILLRRKNYNIEHPPSTLTNLELRLLKLIDYPLDERPETLQQLVIIWLPIYYNCTYIFNGPKEIMVRKRSLSFIPLK